MDATVARASRPVDLRDVTIGPGFWADRQAVNRDVTIPTVLDWCERTGRLAAFDLSWRPGDAKEPHVFWDSDVAKALEAACYSLTAHPDAALTRRVNALAERIASAQQPDGYLNTHFTVVEPNKRFTNLRDQHELYCAGHLIEAGLAHHAATGSDTLLAAVRRYADYLHDLFVTQGRPGYPGHEEIELALVKLYRATGERRYLELALHFLDARGQGESFFQAEARRRGEDPARHWGDDAYYQAHLPVRQQAGAVGHAVRAMYLYCAMADAAAETGDAALAEACRRLWRDVTQHKMYVTGGIGSTAKGEAFTTDYDLPNATAYAETCAAIGLFLFAQRMLELEPLAEYADVAERALYNGVLAGVSLDGRKFFYVNPLASDGGHRRQEWFGCSCCPPNIARLIASLGGYLYGLGNGVLTVHHYVAGEARVTVAGQAVRLVQQTQYPWKGRVGLTLRLGGQARFALQLRVPGWCRHWTLAVNGQPVRARPVDGYVRLERLWSDRDRVELDLTMPVERMLAHPQVSADLGQVALQRGPLVYCLEQADHRADVRTLALLTAARYEPRWDRRLGGGVVVLTGPGRAYSPAGWKGQLYRPYTQPSLRPARVRAAPYFAWDNRQGGPMRVWRPCL